MNGPIRWIAVGIGLLFLALLGNLTYLQGFEADELNRRTDNRRVLLEEYSRERGAILVGGEPIVHSEPTGGTLDYLRTYEDTELFAPITGFYSSVFGAGMLERSENDILSGSDDRLFVRRVIDVITDRTVQGGSASLTIHPEAQRAALAGLDGKKGAVVALEPSTGAVLAMVSLPTYDPNRLASHSASEQQEAWDEYNSDPDNPMNNRATQFTYPPGSTFKLVTAAAALESGDYEMDTEVPAPAALPLPLTTRELNNWQLGLCDGADTITIQRALDTSCNTAFAGIGLELGVGQLHEQAARFGFGERFLTGLGGAASEVPDDMNEPQVALSSIGQQDVRATPLQMAMVTSAIANGGVLMEPHVVDRLYAPDLEPLHVTEPTEVDGGPAVSPRVAEQLRDMMVSVVADGTGSGGAISGMDVGGKTGTAQRGEGQDNLAWFVSFAPADNPEVAVAVVIEDAGVDSGDEISGNRLAAPIAKAVMEAIVEP